jgi:hypothetical protein
MRAVVAGGRHQSDLYEAWISTDPFRGDVRVIITGPHSFGSFRGRLRK